MNSGVRRQSVLCLGEALIDVVIRDDGSKPVEHVGGSPLNVACVLARLGHTATIGAWWADDARGHAIEEHARRHGVAIEPGSDGAEHTSVAQARLDAQGHADYTFDLTWALPPLAGLGEFTHLHTGSIAATLEPGGSQVVDAVRRVREHASTSYDPNIRPSLMGSPGLVRGRIEELVALGDVVKASDEDIAWLYPGEGPDEVLRRWLAMGPALVVVTRGAQGAWALLSGHPEMIDIAPMTVRVADTVGAGDSFMGGLLSGLLDAGLLGTREAVDVLRVADPATVMAALRRAATTSGLTVASPGAHAPARDEVLAVEAAGGAES